MSYTIYKKLLIGVLKPTKYLLKLANGAVKHARGVAKNVVIKVDRFLIS